MAGYIATTSGKTIVTSDPRTDAIERLLQQIGVSSPFELTPLSGGKNNRVFRINTQHKRLLLKIYFQHPEDPRNRLQNEFAFAQFAWNHGLRCVPQPMACDPNTQMGLYEFIEGSQPSQISWDHIQAALRFFNQLNQYRHEPSATRLPLASESCFAIQEHVQLVQRRIEKLQSLILDKEAQVFIEKQLIPCWQSILPKAQASPLWSEDPLTPAERYLSPSDFGFHNALKHKSGQIYFFDFEYAGWDDPAKMVGDFFSQVQVPVPLNFFPDFVSQLPEAGTHLPRAILLFPFYQIKWCCIVLNTFLPVDAQRRQFAAQEDIKQTQLQKARTIVEKLPSNMHDIEEIYRGIS